MTATFKPWLSIYAISDGRIVERQAVRTELEKSYTRVWHKNLEHIAGENSTWNVTRDDKGVISITENTLPGTL